MSVKTVNISDNLHSVLKQAAEETNMSIPQLIQHCLFNQINRAPGFVSKDLRKQMHAILSTRFNEKEYDFDIALEEIGFHKYFTVPEGECFYENKQGIRIYTLTIFTNPSEGQDPYSVEINWNYQTNQSLLDTFKCLKVFMEVQMNLPIGKKTNG